MYAADDGGWVRFVDHVSTTTALQDKRDAAEARAVEACMSIRDHSSIHISSDCQTVSLRFGDQAYKFSTKSPKDTIETSLLMLLDLVGALDEAGIEATFHPEETTPWKVKKK